MFAIFVGLAFLAILVVSNLVLRGPKYSVYENTYNECVKAAYTYRGANRWAKRNFYTQSSWYVRYEK